MSDLDKDFRKVLWDAYIRTWLELSRRVLTLSSGGVAAVTAVVVNLDKVPGPVFGGLTLSVIAFVVAVVATGISLFLSPKHIRAIVDGDKARKDQLNDRIKAANRIGLGAFAFGIVSFIVALLYVLEHDALL
jgi:hypothetical protein